MKHMSICSIVLAVLALCCLLYGILILLVRSGTLFFAVWLALACILTGMVIMNERRLWHRLPAPFLWGVGAVCLAALLVFVWTQALILSSFGAKGEAGLEYVVVLGAQVNDRGPSYVLQRRLDTACEYLEQNPETKVVVSGGQGWNEPTSEAAVMKSYLVEKGIAPERILVEDQSQNTIQNVQYTAKLIDEETAKVGIVTNNFHVYRGVKLAKAQGYGHVAGIAAPSHPLYLVNNMVRESLGIVKDTFAGNLR